jgi:ribonuclease Z
LLQSSAVYSTINCCTGSSRQTLPELGLNVDSAVVEKIAAVHTDTMSLADIAERAQVRRLVITHLIPPIPPNPVAEGLFEGEMTEVYRGRLTLARDGMRIRVTGGGGR